MITPNEKRTHFILDLLVKDNFDYVWVVELKTFQYELHTNEDIPPLDMPESGNALNLLNYIRDVFVPSEYRNQYKKVISARKILKTLKKNGEFTIAFPFTVGVSYVRFFVNKDYPGDVFICSKVIGSGESKSTEEKNEALLILALDARKHFSIRNINENVATLFNVSLLKFSKSLKHDVFCGFHPEDRIAAEKLFLENAKEGNEFSGDFRIIIKGGTCQMIHLDVTVKKYIRSFLYYVTVRKIELPKVAPVPLIEMDENPRRKVHSFDVDLITGTAHLGMEMRKYYQCDSVISNFPFPFIKQQFFHPEDAEKMKDTVKAIRDGSPYEEADVRVIDPQNGSYVWRSIRFNTIFDDFGRPVRALGSSEDISFYKEQETRFHDVLELCGFTTWDYDFNNHTFSNTRRLKKIFGFSDENFSNIPESIIETGAVHSEDIDIVRILHRKLEEGEPTCDCEVRMRNINGGNFNWYKIRYTIVNDKNGDPSYAVGSATDINEQKTAELSFEYEAKTLYELQGDTLVEKCCVNATRDEVKSYFTKAEGEITYKNQSFSEILKVMMPFCVNEDTARLLWNKLNPENLLKSFSQGNKTFSFVYRRQKRSQNLQWVSSKVNMYQDPKTGDIISFIYTYDINRKKLSQEALELIGISDYDLVGIIDVIGGSAIILHDNEIMSRVPNWDCGDYDAYFENFADRMKEYLETEEDYINLHDNIKIANLVHELSQNQIYEVLIKYHKRGSSDTVVFRTTFRYLDEEQSSILLCMSDITSALAEEREREKVLKDALDQANIASHAKTDFLARMSHDIRTPLNGIMGMTQLCLEENDPDLIHEYLRKIDTSSHFLLGLLNDILDMSRIEKGVINLESDVYSLFEFKASLNSIIVPLCTNKDITLNIQIEKDCSFITDKQKFNQVFFNLLSNSVKFTEVGGTIDVIAENVSAAENDTVSFDLIVRDYGCGMSEEFQKKMFEAFSQERNSMTNMNQGSGLGLAIVKSFVEKMGGTIQVQSSTAKENHGTTSSVHFVLPVA